MQIYSALNTNFFSSKVCFFAKLVKIGNVLWQNYSVKPILVMTKTRVFAIPEKFMLMFDTWIELSGTF